MKITKEQLQEIIREEVSIVDKDAKAAKKLKPKLEKAIDNLESVMGDIEGAMSDYNSSGMKVAFLDALQSGILKSRQAFLSGQAKRTLAQYYKGR